MEIPAALGASEPIPEPEADEAAIGEALHLHWRASAAGDTDVEHYIYADDTICD